MSVSRSTGIENRQLCPPSRQLFESYRTEGCNGNVLVFTTLHPLNLHLITLNSSHQLTFTFCLFTAQFFYLDYIRAFIKVSQPQCETHKVKVRK